MGNIGDFNSKTAFDSDPFLLVNSDDWRHGNVAFTNEEFPSEDIYEILSCHSSQIEATKS